MSNYQTQTVQTFFNLLGLGNQSEAVRTAFQSGLLSQLAEGQKSAQELGDALQMRADRVSRFLQFLIPTGLIEQFGDDFALSSAARMIPPGLFQMNQDLWRNLPGWLAENPDSYPQSDEDLSQLFEKYRSLFDWTQTPAALDVIEVLGIGTERKGLNILDLFCGPAIFSMAIAHRDPQAFVTCLDTSSGLERAKETANSIGTVQRCEFFEATAEHDEPLEQKFDLVMLIDQLHWRADESCKNLFTVASKSLRDGGEFLLIDTFAGQDEGDVYRMTMDLELTMSSPERRIKPIKETNQWLEQSGFTDIRFAKLPSPPHVRGAILAAKG